MRLFLHTLSRIRIISGDLDFECTPDQFQALEPDYPGLPTLTQAPAVCRYWTPEWSYVEDSNGVKHPNTHDCAAYCDKIAEYAPLLPVLTVSLSITGGDGRDVPGIVRGVSGQDSLAVTGDIRDAAGTLVPLSYSWRITIVKVRSVAEPVPLDSFTYTVGVDHGDFYVSMFVHDVPGVYMISDADFDIVPGALFGLLNDYRVVLAGGPQFFKVI